MSDGLIRKLFRKVRIEKPAITSRQDELLWKEIEKVRKLIPQESEPNLGRVREIKEELKNGTYLTPELIEETAARLAIRFMKKE